MFWAWFEDWIEISNNLMLNRTTREIQYKHGSSIFFHSVEWMIFAYYLDDTDYSVDFPIPAYSLDDPYY
jgi:hypothetical protein